MALSDDLRTRVVESVLSGGFRRVRCSVFVERAKTSSSARSKSVKVIAVASRMLRIQP